MHLPISLFLLLLSPLALGAPATTIACNSNGANPQLPACPKTPNSIPNSTIFSARRRMVCDADGSSPHLPACPAAAGSIIPLPHGAHIGKRQDLDAPAVLPEDCYMPECPAEHLCAQVMICPEEAIAKRGVEVPPHCYTPPCSKSGICMPIVICPMPGSVVAPGVGGEEV